MSKETITVTPRGAGKREIDRLRADLAAEQSDRSATEEIARQRGAVINALCADIADLKDRIATALLDKAAVERGVMRLRAELAQRTAERGWDCFKDNERRAT